MFGSGRAGAVRCGEVDMSYDNVSWNGGSVQCGHGFEEGVDVGQAKDGLAGGWVQCRRATCTYVPFNASEYCRFNSRSHALCLRYISAFFHSNFAFTKAHLEMELVHDASNKCYRSLVHGNHSVRRGGPPHWTLEKCPTLSYHLSFSYATEKRSHQIVG